MKLSYNDTPTSVAIITGKLLKETQEAVVLLHNGVDTVFPNSKVIKIADYSFMDCKQCPNCNYYNWFQKDNPTSTCQKCGGDIDEVGRSKKEA